MRNRSDVLDRIDFHTDGSNASDSRFSSGARSVDPDFHFLHTESLGLFRGIRSYDLSGISRAFSRAFESVFAGGGPAEHIAVQVGEGYFCIIECSQNKSDSGRT